MNLFDIEKLLSSILLGKLTIFRKAILKPLSFGIELRVFIKSLLTLLPKKSSVASVSTFLSHDSDRLSSLSGDHKLVEKNGCHYGLKPCWCFPFCLILGKYKMHFLRLGLPYGLDEAWSHLIRIYLCSHY